MKKLGPNADSDVFQWRHSPAFTPWNAETCARFGAKIYALFLVSFYRWYIRGSFRTVLGILGHTQLGIGMEKCLHGVKTQTFSFECAHRFFYFTLWQHFSVDPWREGSTLRLTPLTINEPENNIVMFTTLMRCLCLKTIDKGPSTATNAMLNTPIHMKRCISSPPRLSLAIALSGCTICHHTRCVARVVCAAKIMEHHHTRCVARVVGAAIMERSTNKYSMSAVSGSGTHP